MTMNDQLHDWRDVPVFGEPPSGEPAVTRPSAYVVLADEHGRVAIVHTDEGHDHLPGGGLEPGESWHEAILREVREECGFEVELLAWSCRAVDFVHSESERTTFEKLSLFVAARLRGPATSGGAPEHALSWLAPIEAVARLTHPSQGWAVEQWLASRASDLPSG